MAISCLFLTDAKGKVIIGRNYRGDIPTSVVLVIAPVAREQARSATRGVLTRRRRTGDATPNMRTVAVLATVGAARAAAAPDRVAWGARRRAAPALEAEAVPRQDAPRAADDGAWWAAAKSGESAAELERMSSLLRRQLQDGAYSYLFTEGPSTMPSPQPSPMPSAMPVAQPTPATKSPTPDCGDDSLYTLTLTDTDGADGWGGETYTISSDSATVETGTLSSGAEDAVQFCLADGAYTLALSGAGTAVEFASGGLGLQSGPISVPFEAAGGDVNAAPTAKPTPAPSDAPVPAPTPKPTVSMAPSQKPIPAPTAAPVFAPTPKPTSAPVPPPTPAAAAAAVRPRRLLRALSCSTSLRASFSAASSPCSWRGSGKKSENSRNEKTAGISLRCSRTRRTCPTRKR